MKPFSKDFLDVKNLPPQKPDFENLLKVFSRQKPSRPTLFEFFLNDELERILAPGGSRTQAFANAGYDYITLHASDFGFPRSGFEAKATYSLNDGGMIFDRETFNRYPWQDPDECYAQAGGADYFDRIAETLPEGMKIGVMGPCGVLENAIALTGYENLCYMIADEPDLAHDVFNEIGTRLCRYYELCAEHEAVGFIISNDDWGFKTQTMLSTADMRRFVFPYHKRIVQIAHAAGKPAMLHSCGQLDLVMDDVINDMKFDARHSFEDCIHRVEDAYDEFKEKIAVFGGIDLDFLCRSTPEAVYERAVKMIEKTGCEGYALGTGNSVPYYAPVENYLAMIAAVVFNR